jgi:hypothetical protein
MACNEPRQTVSIAPNLTADGLLVPEIAAIGIHSQGISPSSRATDFTEAELLLVQPRSATD